MAAVVVGTLLGLSPTSTRDAVRLVDDPYRLAPTDSAAVRCIPASDDLGRSPFADAKQNACGTVRSRWFLLLAVLVTVIVLAVLIVVWPQSRQRLGPWRLRRLAVIPLLPLLLAGALFTAVIGWLTLGTPPPIPPSAQLADPFGAGAPVEVVFAVDIMGPPSVSIETAPLGITRYVLVASRQPVSQPELLEMTAEQLGRAGVDLHRLDPTATTWWAAYEGDYELGLVERFAADPLSAQADHDDISRLLSQATRKLDRPVVLLVDAPL